MGLLRGAVGFMTFFVGFLLKKQHEAAWVYGLVLTSSASGNGIGVIVAPYLRRKIREEWILSGSLLLPAVLLVFAARSAGRTSLCIAAFSIAAGAACGRLVFDSLVQRDAHQAARGRAFARFETRFQLVWVLGGVLAVLFPGKERGGLFLLALVLLFAGLSYLGTARRVLTLPEGAVLEAQTRAGTTVVNEPLRAARRQLRARVHERRARRSSTSGDDPPDAFPAGG
jgi:hypothetical protein